MHLEPTTEQQQLIDAFSALYGKQSPLERVRQAEPDGFDADLWRTLHDTGAVTMAVPDDRPFGGGATLLDLALVAEQHGRHLAPAPLVEAQVTARLLSRLESSTASHLLGQTAESARLVTIALREPRQGVASLVPGAAVAREAIILDGDRLLCVPLGPNRRPVANVGCMPVADVEVTGGLDPLAEGPTARQAWATAVDEWMALSGAALVGLSAGALELAVAYAKERSAFGVTIGTFQGVAHRLADCATALDGARLLAYEAAWAQLHQPRRFPELAAMSLAFAAQTAQEITYWSMHVHGGYGVMVECDIQLYFRRARAWPAVLANPDTLYRWVADRRRHRGKQL